MESASRNSRQAIGLAIDDTRAIRRLIARTLFESGCIYMSASDGYAGWKLAEWVKPDLVVTDLDMPGWCGSQMIEAIRHSKDRRVRSTTIVVCSSADQFAIREAFDAGADHYLPKPIEVAKLSALVALIVERKHRTYVDDYH